MSSAKIRASLSVCGFLILLSGCQLSDRGASQSDKPTTGSGGSDAIATFDAVDAIEIVESPATGVALGWGWNRGDAEPVPTICVEFVPGEEPAQTRYMTMHEVNDSYELMKALGVSAEASIKSIGFSGSGKAEFAKSQNISSSKSSFVLNAVVQNGVRYAAPVPMGQDDGKGYQPPVNERGGTQGAIRLTDEALRLARLHDPEPFKRLCGSAFVSAIYGGAKLTASISFASSSRSEKQSLRAEMSASGWGARFKGKVENSNTSAASNSSMDIAIFMTGGKGDAIPTSKEDLINKLETISLDAYTAPKDFQIAITPYELLSNWPGRVLPDKTTEFDELASYWGAYNTLYDEFQQVLDAPTEYMTLAPVTQGCEALTCKNQEAKLARLTKIHSELMKQLTATNFIAQLGKVQEVNGAISTARAELSKCQAGTDLAKVREIELAAIKRAQDEVLLSLKRMENEARECADKSDHCSFDAASYRSPYAFRVQLPAPIAADITGLGALVDYQLGRIAKNRCALSSNDPGCLSNAEMDGWGRKLGLESVNLKVRPELFQLQQQAMNAADKADAAAEAKTSCSTPKFEQEAGQSEILWYNPRVDLQIGKEAGEKKA